MIHNQNVHGKSPKVPLDSFHILIKGSPTQQCKPMMILLSKSFYLFLCHVRQSFQSIPTISYKTIINQVMAPQPFYFFFPSEELPLPEEETARFYRSHCWNLLVQNSWIPNAALLLGVFVWLPNLSVEQLTLVIRPLHFADGLIILAAPWQNLPPRYKEH